MPQFDPSMMIPQIFWLVVTFGLLYVVMSRIALPRVTTILEDRQDRIDNDLDKAAQLKHEAEEVMMAYELAVSEARASSRELLETAEKEIKAAAMEKHGDLSAKLTENLEKAEQRIESAKARAMENIKSVAQEVATVACEHLTGLSVQDEQAVSAVDKVTTKKKAA